MFRCTNGFLAYGFTGYVIAAKADKISKGKYQNAEKVIAKKLGIKNRSLIIPYSITNKYNLEKVLGIMEEVLEK